MARRLGWYEAFRGLGEAFIDLLRAEMALLVAAWRRSGKALAVAAACFAVATMILVWLPALGLFALVEWLHRAMAMSLAVAALWVGLGALLLASLIAGVGALVLRRRFENPALSLRARQADFSAWWHGAVLGHGHRVSEGDLDGTVD